MLYIGIDISKDTFTVSSLRNLPHFLIKGVTFDNDEKGFNKFYKTISTLTQPQEDILCCMEYTGVYAEYLCHFLYKIRNESMD